MRKVMDRLLPVVAVGLAIAAVILPFQVIGARLDRHDEEIRELTEKRLELSRRLWTDEEFNQIQWKEQNRINDLNCKMHGQGFMRWDQLGNRIDQLERSANIPPQNLPITPREPDRND